MAGLYKGTTKDQLLNFHNEMKHQLGWEQNIPKTWIEAFNNLKISLSALGKWKRKIILLDELPWMDTHKSYFISALENFWNGWAGSRHDIVLIVCGSSTSWMMDKLINNKGGLHNRLTHSIFLNPFNLYESEKMLQRVGLYLSRYETTVCYMIFGGIPYYMSLLNPDLSLSQNIDALIFNKRGELHNEFDNLYAALFSNSEDYITVVSALSTKRGGLTRDEILTISKLSSGGTISKLLKNLDSCGFIRQYKDIGTNKTIYQLVDFFTLFYFKFLSGKTTYGNNYWSTLQGSPLNNTWAGLTFELLVLQHINQVKQKLGISGVLTEEYGWRKGSSSEERGAQVDLVLDRKDRTVNLCEIKFCETSYYIDAEENLKLRNRLGVFKKDISKPSKSVRLTLITTFGLASSRYNDIVSNSIILDDLFLPEVA